MSTRTTLSEEQSLSYDPERRYDSKTDRLFLIYYPIIPGFNGNKWGVSDSSLHANIHTAINKPVVIYRKNPNNPIHTKQAGSFVHPTPEEAATYLGHPPSAEEYYNWQEKFAVGRVRNVDRRGDKGYAFTLEITDPEAKNILKSDTYRNGIPGWTSPQIISNGHLYPQEEASGIFDHWSIAHIALLDVPAYGYEQAGVRAKCFGAEKQCMIQTKSASQENLGFCVKQATIDLIDSHSSHVESLSNPSHNLMSQNENSSQSNGTTAAETVTYNPTDNTATTTTAAQPTSKISTEQERPEEGKENDKNQQGEGEPTAKTLEEANQLIRSLYSENKKSNERIAAMSKDNKTLMKWKAEIEAQNRFLTVKNIVPSDLFKTSEAHKKEVERIIAGGLDSDLDWLVDHYKLMRDAMKAKHFAEEHPVIAAKSAGQQQHDVPDFSSSQNQNVRSNIQKTLELQKMILEQGGSS